MNSSNYNLENSSLNSGGEEGASTNFRSVDSVGDANDRGMTSTNYKAFPGTLQPLYPGVPTQPTLTNTGGTLYNALDFVITTGGNQTDTEYAIAISSDSFVTTYFIQTNDTLGTSPAWQDYVGWNSGTGERVTGLTPNTLYEIKVKARFEIDTETEYSITASATTAGASISVSFTGINSGVTTEGQTTDITSTSTTVPFGTLVIDTPKVAAQTITVSTNAVNGYTTTIQQDTNLIQQTGADIDPVAGTNASPAVFPAVVTTGAFGYHTSDATLCSGTTTRFTADNTYAAATTTALEVACSATPVSNEDTTIVYKIQVSASQEAGTYQNNITYITTGTF